MTILSFVIAAIAAVPGAIWGAISGAICGAWNSIAVNFVTAKTVRRREEREFLMTMRKEERDSLKFIRETLSSRSTIKLWYSTENGFGAPERSALHMETFLTKKGFHVKVEREDTLCVLEGKYVVYVNL